jgi:hypothetical protein
MNQVQLGWYTPTKQGYAGRQRARWVLAASASRVLYSRGGHGHHECAASTFNAWIRRVAAERNPPAPTELQLEPSA